MLIALSVLIHGNVPDMSLDIVSRAIIFLLALVCDVGFTVIMFEDFSAYKFLADQGKTHEDYSIEAIRH